MKLVDIPWPGTKWFWPHNLTLWTSSVCPCLIWWIHYCDIVYWWLPLFISRLQYLSMINLSYVQMIFLHITVGYSYHIYQLVDCPIQAWYQFLPALPYQTNWWFSWLWFTGRRRGSWHCTLGGFGKDYTTGWTARRWWGKPREYGTEHGYITWWRMWWWMRYCSRWIYISPASIKKLHILLWPVPLWTYVLQQSGGRGEGWSSGGGDSTDWIWRGCGRWIRKRKVQRGRGRRTGQWIWICIESVIG